MNPCVHCGKPAEETLCATCKLGLEKYPDQNPPIVAVYVTAGLAELGHHLERNAEFHTWLINHGGTA